MIHRRSLLAAAAALVPAAAQTPRDWAGREPVRYPDPDIVSLDPRFDKYKIGSAAIERLWTGARWAEGTAWHAAGRYLVWSDIPANRQMRWLEEDAHVSVFHEPSGYSNGNTFDFEGRLVSCQHGHRRVARYEHDGSLTVIADRWNGKPLNSPNDLVVHPDGGIWFTDPTYGILGNYEGFQASPEIPTAVYRADPKTGTFKELGRDVLTFQRMDGVAENFHTEQNRDLLERLANQTGGQYWKPADLGKLASAIPFSEAGVTMRETKDLWNLPLVFLVLLLLRFSEWWLRRKWGIV